MNLTLLISLVVCLLGLAAYAVGSGKVSEAGRLAFACGLLVTLMSFSGDALHLAVHR